MKCTTTITKTRWPAKGKRITVAWCKIGGLLLAIAIFVVVERIYGPF